MVKKDTWKQENPRMQAAALLGSVYGDLHNIRSGVGLKKLPATLERMNEQLLEAMDIVIRWLPNGDWNKQNT